VQSQLPSPRCGCGHSRGQHDATVLPGVGWQGHACRATWCGCVDFRAVAQPAQLVAAVDAAGQTIIAPDDRPQDTLRADHEVLSLFNAPRTMRGQLSIGGIE
jgi:hypothetical protein